MNEMLKKVYAINVFRLTADSNEGVPPLKNKSWLDNHLTTPEWKLVKLVYKCLKVTCPFV